ncbi:MAG: hypothetical protein KBT39_12535 [Bacteroidales bacterium]|nr:hypothetical protein [Bacteroidales bacterium]
MKKILFSLVALVCSMSMNAQVMKVMKGNTVVATYKASQADNVVFEEAPILGKTGTAKATIGGSEVDVNWVQLWENGPRFAVYNVGVTDSKAESYGGHYAWGGSNNESTFDQNTGTTDLTGDSDTATKLWGSNWRMPTKDELQNLNTYCDQEWTNNYNDTNVKGRIFKGKGDYASKSVFLPAAGRFDGSHVTDVGTEGYYWSSTPSGSLNAEYLYFVSGYAYVLVSSRHFGCSVRAVLAE